MKAMIPEIDLFHQRVASTDDGYVVVKNCTEVFPKYDVYTLSGEWCGCSGASCPESIRADVRIIIRYRRSYEQRHARH